MRKILAVLFLCFASVHAQDSFIKWQGVVGSGPWTDNFNRTNEIPLVVTGNWRLVENQCSLYGNEMQGDGASVENVYRWNANTFNNDQYGQVKISNLTGTGGRGVGIVLRVSNSAETYYYGVWEPWDGHVYIGKNVNGSNVFDYDAGSATAAVGDILYFSASGSSTTTLTFKVNGAQTKTYDDSSTPLTSGYVGFMVYSNLGSGLDDWEGGNL
jgi:hypothetical protein